MNDRFKFRCWDDYNREMLDMQEQDTNPYNISDFAQHNIMQCTGLKDKNGKLIFEGDIVKNYYFKDGDVDTIIFDNKYACFRLKNDNHSEITNCEIIGNIYENSDLLK